MTTQSRVSNKQILDALNGLSTAIAQAMASNAAPATVVAEPETPSGEATIKVDGAYLSHMTAKVQDFANSKGEDCILYARTNGRGEVKLAYCLASKWTTLKDRGLKGAVKHLSPTS